VGVGAPFFAGFEADGAHDLLAAPEHVRRRIGREDEFILRSPLVF
jgi:hypothetical protein